MAVEGKEYADEHQEALIRQAILSGGVTNTMIEAYREAIKGGNEDEIREIGAQIADATEKIVESNEGRDAYSDLVDRVIDAIAEERQKEIDSLTDLNDTIKSTNDKLLNKLQ
jgi:predicted  nucleic acid-binding Zn-ribbon protein